MLVAGLTLAAPQFQLRENFATLVVLGAGFAVLDVFWRGLMIKAISPH